jgi:hypothetical protein
VLEHENEIVSACRVTVQALRVGTCQINKGDVGMVGTLPHLQRQGHGSELMAGLDEQLRERDCQVGRLGGLMRFYSRFGWEPFPRRTVEFPLRSSHAGTQVMWPDEYLEPPLSFMGDVVPYDPKAHYEARASLHEAFYGQRSGAQVVAFRETVLREGPDETGLRVTCVLDGDAVGYMLAEERPDAGPADAQVEIEEFGFDPEHPDALGAMLVHILREAYARGAEMVVARMPFDHAIERAMISAGVRFRWVETHSGPAGNMIRVIDPGELMRRVCPELERRLANSAVSDWSGEIAFCLPDGGSAVLEIGAGKVAAQDWAPGKIRVELDQATMVSLVLGINGFGERATAQMEGDSRLARAACEALFPRCPTASGAWA